MNQKTIPAYLFVMALFLVAGFASMVAVAKNDNATSNGAKGEKTEKSTKTEKSSQGETKKVTKEDLKNYKKADEAKGETNAKVHKEKTTEVIENLEQVTTETEEIVTAPAAQVDVEKKKKAKKQIEEVTAEQGANQEQIAEAIDEVESEGAVKKFVFGPDYKNLGQLRSELVQNRNQIRKLTQSIGTLSMSGGDTAALQTQLATLTQERERIKSIITTNQDTFSLLGWVSRFLNNYEETPINETEEEELTNEVVEAIENAQENETPADTTTGTGTTTTTGTGDTSTTTDTTTPAAGTDTTTTPTTTTTGSTDTTGTTGTTTPEIVQ